MRIISAILVAIVALLHIGFAVLEMALWTEPKGMEIFGTSPEFAAESASLAMNQGLYNLFLATGLVWGLISNKRDVTVFFLLCVITAGVFGAMTVKPTIFYVQGLPALAALAATVLHRR